MEIKIQEENLMKAYNEGCNDVKKVLRTLAPDVFAVKFPCFVKGNYTEALYLFLSEYESIRLNNGVAKDWDNSRYPIGVVITSLKCSDQIPIKGIKEA